MRTVTRLATAHAKHVARCILAVLALHHTHELVALDPLLPTAQEHAAWDCSSVLRRLAIFVRHFQRHLNEKDLQGTSVIFFCTLFPVRALP